MGKRVEKAERAIAKALRAIQRAQAEVDRARTFTDRVADLEVALRQFRVDRHGAPNGVNHVAFDGPQSEKQ